MQSFDCDYYLIKSSNAYETYRFTSRVKLTSREKQKYEPIFNRTTH